MCNLNEIYEKKVYSIGELVDYVKDLKKLNIENKLYFRGENNDWGVDTLKPSIYRTDKFLEKEEVFYREMQRFNDHEFTTDRTAIDKLARLQHYNAPTRLIDLSEDILSATYFALDNKEKGKDSVVYIIEIDKSKIKYYDSDAVSVVANLAKIPLENKENKKKSKEDIRFFAEKYKDNVEGFNQQESTKFLLHEIKEEKSHFEHIIDPEHIFSIFCVRPKYNNLRIHTQKGAFLLFGLNKYNSIKPIDFIREVDGRLFIDNSYTHPIVKITKIILDSKITLPDLEKLGITLPYIYPEIDKVGEYLKKI